MGEKIYCNCCGKEISVKNETQIAMEDYVEIKKTWGYFSKKDGICQKMNICEDCFDAWVQTFQMLPQESEQTELL